MAAKSTSMDVEQNYVTVGRRSFSVAASTFWNTLPNDIQSALSLSSFRRQLKTFLFHQSFPDIIL